MCSLLRHLKVLAVLIPSSWLTVGCVNMAGDGCVEPRSGPGFAVKPGESSAPICDGAFLSSQRQRGIVYAGDDQPRLWTGEASRRAQDIDPRQLNAPPEGYEGRGSVTAYLGTLKLTYEAREPVVATDVAALRNAVGRRFDPDQKVTINFNKATLDYVLKQMLGGVLGLNYIAPSDLGGSVTFRTEEPVPKSQVLQIVRDILARNGLEVRSINGVYHVGKPELIASIETAAEAGRASERVTRILRLTKGKGSDLLSLAQQVAPPGIEIIPSNNPDTVLVRAAPNEIDQAEALIKGLIRTGLDENRVAVIRLRRSAPDQVAQQINDLLSSQKSDPVSIVPLNGQQAILVSTTSPGMIENVKQLAAALDTEARDEVALRVIPLQHLVAEEIAQRLAAIFGAAQSGGDGRAASSGAKPVSPETPGSGPGRNAGFVPRLTPPSAEAGILPPAFTRLDRAADGRRESQPTEATAANMSGSATRIVADKTSNTVLVYSTYSLFKKIRAVVQTLDVPPAQVVIEATVAEVELSDQLQAGVQVFLQGAGFTVGSGNLGSVGLGSQGGTASSLTSGGGIGGIAAAGVQLGGSLRVDAVLRALQDVTRVKVISSPYLTVLHGKQARLVIGDQIPYSQRSQTANNLGNTTVTEEISVKDTGIILDITPQIHANNSVELKINQSVSTPSQSAQAGNLTPIIATRSVESDILLQSGRTVLLAGLIQDRLEQQENGVPVLRTVPVVGDLFKQKSDKVRRVELILMLTPRVTRNTTQTEELVRLLHEQTHIH